MREVDLWTHAPKADEELVGPLRVVKYLNALRVYTFWNQLLAQVTLVDKHLGTQFTDEEINHYGPLLLDLCRVKYDIKENP